MRITNDTPFHSFGQYLKGMFKESKGVVVQETLDNPFDRKHFRLIDNRKDPIHGVFFAKIYGNVVFLLKTEYLEDVKNLAKMYESLFATEPEITIIDLG